MGFLDDQRHHDLPTVLSYQAQHRPDRPWILSGIRHSVISKSMRCQAGLLRALAELVSHLGTRVLCMSQNRVEQVFLWCALSKCGAPLVPVNTHYRGNIFAYLINDSLPRQSRLSRNFCSSSMFLMICCILSG